MNTNQFSNFQKLAEKNEWKNYIEFFKKEFGHYSFQKKVAEIHYLQSQYNTDKIIFKRNMIKWSLFSLGNEWAIEENKEENIKILIESCLENLHPNQLLDLFSYFEENHNNDRAQLCLSKIWSFSPSVKWNRKDETVFSFLKQLNQVEQTVEYLNFLIDIGDAVNAKKAYLLFYNQYFKNYDLEDEVSSLWEKLWKKVNAISENWVTWELIKLDVGLITDIIIKNKTGLQLPYYRKKREIAKAVVFIKMWETFYSTLLKYFHQVENKEITLEWISFIESKKYELDIDSLLIIKNYKIERPKKTPVLQKNNFEVENETQIINDADSDDVNGYTQIKNKLDMLIPAEPTREDENEVFTENIPWKEKMDMLSMQKNYEGVLNILRDNKEKISTSEKMDYEIYEMEIMIKLGMYTEVLEKLEGSWKGVQELEIFKILKYLEGECLWMLNRKREANDCFRKVVDIDPSYKLAKWRLIENSL
jgi:hypothetical protein